MINVNAKRGVKKNDLRNSGNSATAKKNEKTNEVSVITHTHRHHRRRLDECT